PGAAERQGRLVAHRDPGRPAGDRVRGGSRDVAFACESLRKRAAPAKAREAPPVVQRAAAAGEQEPDRQEAAAGPGPAQTTANASVSTVQVRAGRARPTA